MDLVIESLTKKVLENQWSPGPGPLILNYPLDYPLCYKHLQTTFSALKDLQRLESYPVSKNINNTGLHSIGRTGKLMCERRLRRSAFKHVESVHQPNIRCFKRRLPQETCWRTRWSKPGKIGGPLWVRPGNCHRVTPFESPTESLVCFWKGWSLCPASFPRVQEQRYATNCNNGWRNFAALSLSHSAPGKCGHLDRAELAAARSSAFQVNLSPQPKDIIRFNGRDGRVGCFRRLIHPWRIPDLKCKMYFGPSSSNSYDQDQHNSHCPSCQD